MAGVNVYIDLSSLTTPVKISNRNIIELQESILWESSNVVINNWREEADRNLNRTRRIYQNAISNPDINKNISIIELVGTLPNMLEDGCSAFDLKESFIKSLKRKEKKNGGWFLTIPFRWATADAIADNEVFSGKMPSGVYEVAKEIDSSYTQPEEQKIVYGGSLDKRDLPKIFQGYGTRKEIKNEEGVVLYGSYKHKSNIYEGMLKMEKSYEKTTQSKYMTFRRVSDLSDPMSWIHPGLTARKFADTAVNDTDFDFLAGQIVNDFLNRVL